MCILSDARCLYHSHYYISFCIKENGSVEGKLITTGSREYIFVGIFSKESNNPRFAFSIDWNHPTKNKNGFTTFLCEIINPDIAIVDWLKVPNYGKKEPTKGYDILFSDEFISQSKHFPVESLPFPIESLPFPSRVPNNQASNMLSRHTVSIDVVPSPSTGEKNQPKRGSRRSKNPH